MLFDINFAYGAFFVCLALFIGSLSQIYIQLKLVEAQIGAKVAVKYDFGTMGINLMLWSGLTAWLFHINFLS